LYELPLYELLLRLLPLYELPRYELDAGERCTELELRVVAVAERVPAVDPAERVVAVAERVVAVAERVPVVDPAERETENDPALRADSERETVERLADAERAAAVVWLPKVRLLTPDERPLTPALRLADDASREATRACASDVLRISRALVIPTLRRSNE